MKKFVVEYTLNEVECAMDLEAADMETAKKTVNQWRVDRLIFRKDAIKIDAITEVAEWPEPILK